MTYRTAVCRRVDRLSGERCRANAYRITDPNAPPNAGWLCERGHVELDCDIDLVMDTAIDEEQIEEEMHPCF